MTMTRNAAALLALALSACGGAQKKAESGSSKSGHDAREVGEGTTDHDGLADFVVRHGGIPTLAGSLSTPPIEPDSLHLDRLDPHNPIKLDGLLSDWPARTAASELAMGDAAHDKMEIALQYDDAKIYVGAEITDRKLVRTEDLTDQEDHASLVVAFPTPAGQLVTYEIGLFAGKPGDSVGAVRFVGGAHKGQDVPGAKIIEAPSSSGYTFEATIPWSAFAEASTTRIGLRGVARYYGADAPGSLVSIVATGPGDFTTPQSLPPLPTDSEQAMIEQLLLPKGLAAKAPLFDAVADVAGSAMLERVTVYGKYLTICGSNYLGGTKFYFKDLGGQFISLDLKRATGRAKADLLLRRRFTRDDGASAAPPKHGQHEGGAAREWFEVLSILGDGEPATTFRHEIAVVSGPKRIDDDVQVHSAQREIDVKTDTATGWDASSYSETISTDVDPVLLPWGTVLSQVYTFDGARFVKSSETPNPNAIATSAAAAAATSQPSSVHLVEPPTPPVTHPTGDLSKQLFDLYKHDRRVGDDVTPRFDLAVSVSGDARPERVVLMGKDLVVFGPGFKAGTSYAYVTLAQFSDGADIHDVAARDLTGDGRADLIVRGVRHVTPTMPTGTAGGSATPVDMDMVLVYSIAGDALTRVFAAETAREQSGKRVQEMLQFIPSSTGKGFDILVAPGRATGWSQQTYPWQQEKPGGGSVEPLLLPWGGISRVTYAWNGSQFVQ